MQLTVSGGRASAITTEAEKKLSVSGGNNYHWAQMQLTVMHSATAHQQVIDLSIGEQAS